MSAILNVFFFTIVPLLILINKFCAKFGAFDRPVTITLTCEAKPPDYKGNSFLTIISPDQTATLASNDNNNTNINTGGGAA